MELDETDRAILRILQADARTPFSEVARRIDMSSATAHDRVSRMEDANVIEGYHAAVDPTAVGYAVRAFIGLRVEQGREEHALDRLLDILPALKREDSHGTVPLGWDIVVYDVTCS